MVVNLYGSFSNTFWGVRVRVRVHIVYVSFGGMRKCGSGNLFYFYFLNFFFLEYLSF